MGLLYLLLFGRKDSSIVIPIGSWQYTALLIPLLWRHDIGSKIICTSYKIDKSRYTSVLNMVRCTYVKLFFCVNHVSFATKLNSRYTIYFSFAKLVKESACWFAICIIFVYYFFLGGDVRQDTSSNHAAFVDPYYPKKEILKTWKYEVENIYYYNNSSCMFIFMWTSRQQRL